MRVLAVCIANPLRKTNGATGAGVALATALCRQGTAVDLAVMWDCNQETVEDGVVVTRFESSLPIALVTSRLPRFARIPLYRSSIPRLVRSGAYDLVHIHNLIPGFAALEVARTCEARDIPYVVHTHGIFELSRFSELNGYGPLRTFLAGALVRGPAARVLRGADCIFTLSDRDEDVLAALKCDDVPTRLVTNGVDEYFLERSAESELGHVRSKFDLAANQSVLLYMGSITAYKGADTFLRVAALTRGPRQVIMAGHVPSGRRSRELRRLAQSVPGGVTFTGGVTRAELRALYQVSDVLLYPTRGDTLPLVVLEAMASGLPVVASDVGGVGYALGGGSGRLVPANDIDRFVEETTELLRNPSLARQLGLSGRQRVCERFSWSASAEEARAGYLSVLGSAGTNLDAHGARRDELACESR